MVETGYDFCGRLEVSRADRERLCADWVAAHGLPRNDAELIQQDQYVARCAAFEIEERLSVDAEADRQMEVAYAALKEARLDHAAAFRASTADYRPLADGMLMRGLADQALARAVDAVEVIQAKRCGLGLAEYRRRCSQKTWL